MKKYTRILAMLLCLVMVFSLCACGGGATTSEDEVGGLLGFEDETASGVGGTSAPTTSGGTVSNVTVQGEADGEVEFTDPTSSSKPTVSGNKPSSNSSASGSTSSSNSTSSATSSTDPLENKENWVIVSFPTTPQS